MINLSALSLLLGQEHFSHCVLPPSALLGKSLSLISVGFSYYKECVCETKMAASLVSCQV